MKSSNGTVLFISHDTSRTGGAIFLLRFLQWFRQNQATPFRTLVRNGGALLPEFQALSPVDFFEPNPTFAYRVLRRLHLHGKQRSGHLAQLQKTLSEAEIRLVYANTIVNGEILDFLSFLKCPVICHVHELESSIKVFGSRNMSQVRKYASEYIAVSQAVKNNLVENHGIRLDKIRMIHGFIPVPQGEPGNAASHREAVYEELGIPTASKLVCSCGSIEPRKGTDLFLQIAERVTRQHTQHEIHFLWVGGSPELVDRMRKEIGSSRLKDSVHFLGPKGDPTPYYDAADVFLLPSREDPFPLVMMESALREKPVLCFGDSGGAPEFVGQEDAGFVIPGFDTGEMADKISALLASPSLSKRMGTAGRQKVLTHHNLATSAPKIAEMIQAALLLS